VAVLSIGGLLRQIPLASLAAVLLLVGYKLAKPSLFVQMWKAGRMQFLPFLLTVGFMAVTNDLLRGVALGLAMALVHILWKNYKMPFQYDPLRYKPGMPIYIELSEDVTFLNKAAIKRTLNEVPNGARVVIDAGRSVDLDPDVREIIEEFASTTKDRNIKLQRFNFPPGPGEQANAAKSMLADKD
jgi:MFS superfamily sulfate permease-like transporter